ncbi:DUF2530 domain-containing protein [Microbispora amethystogenes]|uniref:DUF2530 domain-containing protein n=1 Tax=Microbispora amethystogenes TaxID=1427754 RepID=A0ABQ4FJR3_9ACTN|nr:DUF2530 domain-containing protein [Microbispora amethystogenes]GIH35054.1 hypothetical protein Mam01_52180 [Microbispora amethystogenes]
MSERRPDPPPLRTRDTLTILTGTVLWAVALVVVLVVVRPADTRLVWTCVAGVGLGLFGLLFVRRRDARVRDAAPASGLPGSEPHRP